MKSCEKERDAIHKENGRLTVEICQLEEQVKNYEKKLNDQKEVSKTEREIQTETTSSSHKESQTINEKDIAHHQTMVETNPSQSHTRSEERKRPCEDGHQTEDEQKTKKILVDENQSYKDDTEDKMLQSSIPSEEKPVSGVEILDGEKVLKESK